MNEESVRKADTIEITSTVVIILLSLVAIVSVFSGRVKLAGETLGANEAVIVIAFAILVNLALVYYQVKSGQKINKLLKRPYI